MLNNLERTRQPMGHGRRQAAGVDHRKARLRGPRRRRQDPGAGRGVPVLGRAAGGRWKTARRSTHQGHRRSCCDNREPGTSRSRCSGAGPAETCNRRPGPPPGQRVRVQHARPAEHRDAQRRLPLSPRAPGRRSSRPARTASTPSAASTRSSAATTKVIHHTQLLAKLVGKKASSPRSPSVDEKITYHDPCASSALAQQGLHPAPPGAHRRRPRHTQAAEMHRCKGKGFLGCSSRCSTAPACGWKSGPASGSTPNGSTRPSPLDPDTITTACPYCTVMLGDAVQRQESRLPRPGQRLPRGHRRRPAARPLGQASRGKRGRGRGDREIWPAATRVDGEAGRSRESSARARSG